MELNSTSRDPATESRLSSADIERVLLLGPVGPKLDFLKSTFGEKSPRLQAKWYDLHDWIEYSVEKDAVFCFYCSLFGRQGKSFCDFFENRMLYAVIIF